MRDQDDALALVAQAREQPEQIVDFRRREHGGRLVEHEQVGAARESARDLEPLHLRDRERVGARLRIERQVEALEQRARLRVAAPWREPRGAGLAQHEVLRDRERGHEHEVLVHHADAERERAARIRDLDLAPVDLDPTRVGTHAAVQGAHERRLARAVLAEQRMHGARLERKARAAQRLGRAEALADVA